ncbi:arsenical resistance protein ArsH, partial [Salmonella enterica subsp. enterica serovar Pomona]
YDRIVDVAEELFKITLLLKGHTEYLASRYSERKESHQDLSARVNQAKI